MKTKNLLIIVVCSLVLTLAYWTIKKAFAPQQSPQISYFVLVSIDALRADRLGCYGNQRDVSPFIDQLAMGGTQFLGSFTSQAFTPPSHASMFTSLYPDVFDIPLNPKLPTIASLLSENGYQTTAFTADGFLSEGYGVLNGFNELDDHVIGINNLQRKVQHWIETNHTKKFFLFLHTYYVHVPYAGPEKYFSRYADQSYSGPIENKGESTQTYIEKANNGEISVTPEDIQRLFDIYDSQIKRIDDLIRDIVENLKKWEIYDQTMLILTSDHGEQFYEFGKFQHYSLENPFADVSTRVPLIISCPILNHSGKYEGLVELIDLPPTILDAAGIEKPDIFQGQSLYPIISGRTHSQIKNGEAVFYYLPNIWGLRTKDKKLILNLRSPPKMHLYDLTIDPEEQQNVYNDKKKDDRIQVLLAQLMQIQGQNESLRRNLGLLKTGLEKKPSDHPIEFDEKSALLVNFENNTADLRKENSVVTYAIDTGDAAYATGLHGKSLSLNPGQKVKIPINAQILQDSGSIEFWIKTKKEAAQPQEIFTIHLKSKTTTISIFFNVIWGWGRERKKRTTLHLRNQTENQEYEDINFSMKVAWDEWNHLLIAWEDDDVFFLVNGTLESRKKDYSGKFFDQDVTSVIEFEGENSLIDEFRISSHSRLKHQERAAKKINPKVLERLKTLGYIN